MNSILCRACVCCCALFLASHRLSFAEAPATRQEFVSAYCLDCHSGDDAEAGFDLEQLSQDYSQPERFSRWTQVFDRVAEGEMPPADYGAFTSAAEKRQRSEFLERLGAELHEFQAEQQATLGRVRGRRLTNLQLERTLHALLGIDIPLEVQMPELPKTGEFSTLASQQSISHFHLEQHLKVVDLSLDEAFRRALTPADEWSRDMTGKQISRTRTRTREPEYIDGGAVVWSSNLAFYGRLPATTAEEDGWYRFTFTVSSLNTPEQSGVWCSVRSGECVSSAPLMAWVGSFEAVEQPRQVSFDAWLPAEHMLEIRPADGTLKRAKFQGGQSANGEGGKQNVPGITIHEMTVARIHQGPQDTQIRKLLFGDLSVDPHRQPSRARIATTDPLADGKRLVRDFATRAFRKSPSVPEAVDAEAARFDQIFEATYQSNQDFVAALQAAYRAILCSARFLYLQEQPGKLDDYAIASRLSYMLWNSMPDAELLQAAAAGELQDNHPELIRQVTRMLAQPAGRQFVKDFANQWLELSEIDFTEPDSKLHPNFDMIVQYAMLDETTEFLQHMLDENRNVAEFVSCEQTFLNERLARYYGIDGVRGDRMQPVALDPKHHRGGLLAQGAILKVTANGTHTSPVIRGVWVSERILGQPIPPPPANVPAIEPDIRGAKTIREQLEKHRSQSECAVCHRKIDPPGYALESFDAAGQWREFYPLVQGGRVSRGTKIDSSYVTPAGQAFSGFEEFCRLQAKDVDSIARNFAEQLLTYGTGAKISFADRQELDRIVARAAEQNFGMRSLLNEVVSSSIFLSK